MSGQYYMGLDNGGTLCKAVLFDEKGNEISSAFRKLVMETPRPGHTERDMDVLWQKNAEAIKECVKKSGVSAGEIKALSFSGHGKGLYLWGKDDTPCYKGIVSTDSRAWEYPKKWYADGTAEKVFEKTCQQVLASQPVSLLNWIRDNESGVIERIKWIFSVKDYIRYRLTGEAFAEITDMSGTNQLNLKTRAYDRDLLALFGLEELSDRLPPLKKSTDFCGGITAEAAALTGLAEGTPVAGGMFDIDACAVAMDITDDSNLCVIAGTWSINEYISKTPVTNGSIMMNSLYCLDEYYLIEECSPTSAGNLDWYVENYMQKEKAEAERQGRNIFQYCDELVASLAPEDQPVVFLPYIFGSNYNPKARASFIGLDPSHTQAHRVRAVFEGIVFCHMVHIEKLLQNRAETRAIRLAGGAANSRVWAHMFADVTGLPVEIIDSRELGALGCAMAASVAAGAHADLKTAASAMVSIKEVITPDVSKKTVYNRKFEQYKRVSGALDGLW